MTLAYELSGIARQTALQCRSQYHQGVTTMSAPLSKGATFPIFGELDRVRLKTQVRDKDTLLPAGKQGTIVLCHGTEAYEVEFPDIQDFFQIKAQDLERA